MIYYTSDLHFSHRNVINYCNRPWADVGEMNEALFAIWNEQVTPLDTVYVLGDVSLNPKAMEQYVPRLNGKKILVPGNHDVVFPFKGRELDKKIKRYLAAGWDTITPQVVSPHTLSNGMEVMLTHLPPLVSKEFDDRYPEYRPMYDGVVIHGHLHCRYLKRGKHIDVGIDNDFKLISEDKLISIIEDGREFIPSRLTEFYKRRPSDGAS